MEKGRLSLFIVILANQGNDSHNDQAELKNSFPCNIHKPSPPFYHEGGKRRDHPRKRSRGTAYRGTTDSTKDSIPQDSGNCKQKTGLLENALSLRTSAHAGVAIPRIFKHLGRKTKLFPSNRGAATPVTLVTGSQRHTFLTAPLLFSCVTSPACTPDRCRRRGRRWAAGP